MNQYSFLQLLRARPPSRLVRFPDIPLEQALAELAIVRDALAQPPAPAVPPAPLPAAVAPTFAPLELPLTAAPDETLDAGLAALATNVWRAKSKMIDPITGEPREESRRPYRHVEAAFETFQDLGVRLSDWRDQPYDAGLPVKVLSFQPTPGLQFDTVIEVVRPAVFWHDRLLQVGEVIVGTPETSPDPAS
jgi:hypothetical protein